LAAEETNVAVDRAARVGRVVGPGSRSARRVGRRGVAGDETNVAVDRAARVSRVVGLVSRPAWRIGRRGVLFS
jgi:hypothetical protein